MNVLNTLIGTCVPTTAHVSTLKEGSNVHVNPGGQVKYAIRISMNATQIRVNMEVALIHQEVLTVDVNVAILATTVKTILMNVVFIMRYHSVQTTAPVSIHMAVFIATAQEDGLPAQTVLILTNVQLLGRAYTDIVKIQQAVIRVTVYVAMKGQIVNMTQMNVTHILVTIFAPTTAPVSTHRGIFIATALVAGPRTVTVTGISTSVVHLIESTTANMEIVEILKEAIRAYVTPVFLVLRVVLIKMNVLI